MDLSTEGEALSCHLQQSPSKASESLWQQQRHLATSTLSHAQCFQKEPNPSGPWCLQALRKVPKLSGYASTSPMAGTSPLSTVTCSLLAEQTTHSKLHPAALPEGMGQG